MNTHDYTATSWGHSYVIMSASLDSSSIRLGAWGRGVKVGDTILLRSQRGNTMRYIVSADLEYMRDPTDQFFCTATLAKDAAP